MHSLNVSRFHYDAIRFKCQDSDGAHFAIHQHFCENLDTYLGIRLGTVRRESTGPKAKTKKRFVAASVLLRINEIQLK